MLTQLNPDIGAATDQAVLNLKEVEACLVSLKNDLALLCQGLGNVEAARIAAAPIQPPVAGFPGFPGTPQHLAYAGGRFAGLQAPGFLPQGHVASLPIATPHGFVTIPLAYGNPFSQAVPVGIAPLTGYNSYPVTPGQTYAALPWGMIGTLPPAGQPFMPATPIQVGLR